MSICEVLDCNKPAKARGFCSAHYSKLTRTGSVLGAKHRNPNGFIPTQPKLNCDVEGCVNPHLSLGLCNMHYIRQRNHGDTSVKLTGTKDDPCSKCKINERAKNTSWCRPCLNESSRKWNASEGGPRWRRYKLKKSAIEQMKQAQLNACAICGDSFNDVMDHVDHDNRCCPQKTSTDVTCGKCVRALLCGSCNQGLGNFKDNPERLMNAINYLRKWGIE